MRLIMIILLAFLAAPLWAKGNNVRILTLDAQGIKTLKATCGAGFLKVEGKSDLRQIRVTAEIRPQGMHPQKLKEVTVLQLKREGDSAVLISKTKNSDRNVLDWLLGTDSGDIEINITVELPQNMNVHIVDGSGSTDIRNIIGHADITDGSGYLTVQNVHGPLQISDGSGGMLVENITGTCRINDGSGEMTLKDMSGDVQITDGSGSLFINTVDGTLEITDGSGDIEIRHVTQNVIIRDGSGDIRVNDIGGDLVLKSAGSGKVITNDIRGKIIGWHD